MSSTEHDLKAMRSSRQNSVSISLVDFESLPPALRRKVSPEPLIVLFLICGWWYVPIWYDCVHHACMVGVGAMTRSTLLKEAPRLYKQ